MMDSSTEDDYNNGVCKSCGVPCIEETIVKTYPPVVAYIGTSPTICHMLKQKRPFCCLQISEPCDHCDFFLPNHYQWKTPAIIVAVDKTSTGLYNLIIPLRAYYRPAHDLNPIILLLELEDNETPNPAFLDVIAWFPMIYWMQGKISSTISTEMDKKLQEERKARRQVVTMQKSSGTGRKKLRELVKSRMKNLGMDEDDYAINDSRKTLSYVIINPSYDLELEAGDIVYVLRAPVKESARGFKMYPKRLLKKPSKISPESMLLTTYHDETSTEILPSMI
uniref:RCK N-terminal domain-containing protein n=1 Tax=Acrobeloides nanus TaxID=290746 RepID=A0A914D659_9BILA